MRHTQEEINSLVVDRWYWVKAVEWYSMPLRWSGGLFMYDTWRVACSMQNVTDYRLIPTRAEVDEAEAEIERLKELLESHGPEGRNVTNLQYQQTREKYLSEREKYQAEIADLRAEIERLRAEKQKAYGEGYESGHAHGLNESAAENADLRERLTEAYEWIATFRMKGKKTIEMIAKARKWLSSLNPSKENPNTCQYCGGDRTICPCEV